MWPAHWRWLPELWTDSALTGPDSMVGRASCMASFSTGLQPVCTAALHASFVAFPSFTTKKRQMAQHPMQEKRARNLKPCTFTHLRQQRKHTSGAKLCSSSPLLALPPHPVASPEEATSEQSQQQHRLATAQRCQINEHRSPKLVTSVKLLATASTRMAEHA